MRLIVAGSRDFNDYSLLKSILDILLKDVSHVIEIVSGTAKGADTLGERYANEHGHQIRRFPADWDTHGKRAGYLRNIQMADYATNCILFWDGQSKGTKMMADICDKKRVPYKTIKFDHTRTPPIKSQETCPKCDGRGWYFVDEWIGPLQGRNDCDCQKNKI